jgi:hypothetical protein
MPAELTTMLDGALSVVDAAGSGNWKAASTTVSEMVAAWTSHRSTDVPRPIEPLLDGALKGLAAAVGAHRVTLAQNAAIEAARLSLDLQLRYRPVTEIDLARLDLWAAQLVVDEAAGDTAGVAADHYALDYVRDRIRQALDEATSLASTSRWGRSRSA